MKASWWTRRSFDVRRAHMSSVYLCPLLFLLACLEVDTFAPLVPTLAVLGAVTGIVFLASGANTPQRTLLSILGHCAVYLPYCARAPTSGRVSRLPSACLTASVLGAYHLLDVWPYCITPTEFAAIAAVVLLAQ